MIGAVEALNAWGDTFLALARPMFVQSSLLVVVLGTLDLLFGRRTRPALRYACWTLVLARLVLPPSIAWPTSIAYWVVPGYVATGHLASLELPGTDTAESAFVRDITVRANGGLPSQGSVPLPPNTATVSLDALLLMLWAIGVLAIVFLMMQRARTTRTWLRSASPAPDWLTSLLEECRQRFGISRPVGLLCTDCLATPVLYGVRRPVVVVPRSVAETLERQELRAVLLHELAHVVRGDAWVGHVQLLLQAVYWYNPAVWIANAMIRRTREQAVDDLVMEHLPGQGEAYPQALLRVARMVIGQRQATEATTGVLEVGRHLATRLHRLLRDDPVPSGRLGWSGVVVVGLVGALIVPMNARPASTTVKRNPTDRAVDERLIATPPRTTGAGSAESPGSRGRTASDVARQVQRTRIASVAQAATGAQDDGVAPRSLQPFRGILGMYDQTPTPQRARLVIPPRSSTGAASAFSEVSIRPHVSGNVAGHFDVVADGPRGGWLNAIGVTIADLIGWAYETSDRDALGGPSWVHATRFDVRARIDAVVPSRMWKGMMQRVLEERFGLTLRLEHREMPIYAARLASADGPHGAYIEPAGTCARPQRLRIAPPGALVAGGCGSIKSIASIATSHFGVPVIDETGIAGLWEMWMYWAPESGEIAWDRLYRNVRLEQVDAPRFLDALEQHLGVRLERSYGLADQLVLVNVSSPTLD